MEQSLNTETLIIELLLVASLVAIAVHRLHIPYTVALVVGLAIAFQQPFEINLTPEVASEKARDSQAAQPST